MPVYTYRRADGTTFDYRQKFTDEPLAADPATGQHVVRVVQTPSIVFKGSGFYVTDSRDSSRKSVTSSSKSSAESKSESDAKPETKETKTAAPKAEISAAAD